MSVQLEILRRESPTAEPYWQRFSYTPRSGGETVATALTRLNETPELRDLEGNPAAPIRWEHSCLQKKCGACAMVICGRPGLACGAQLSEYGDVIRLEPLKKFPVVADLVVDRSVLFENLKALSAWLPEGTEPDLRETETAYEASRCLQCGCCLEVCPNFLPGGMFAGAAGAVPASRILEELDAPRGTEQARSYRKHIYEGCGKSLSCKNICPAGIDVEHLMVKSNGAAVWNRFRRKRKGED